MLYRTEGIVIRSMDYGEGNKIVTILTPGLGKRGVVIRGARKPKSRYGALAQLFTYGEYAFYKSGSLGTLSSGEVIEPFRELREDLMKASYASYAAELTDKGVGDEEASGFLFGQLRACLAALAEGKDPNVVLRIYEMKVAAFAGYSPMLDACVICGRTEGEFVFSAPSGGALCPACRERDRHALVLDDGVWKLLRLFARLDLGRIGSISVKDRSKKQLEAAFRSWLDTHMGLNLKSRHFLDQLERTFDHPAFDNPDTVG